MKTMTGAQIVIESLLAEGVDTIFGYPGGAILPTYDALVQNPALRHILVRHEQGAAHMAEGICACVRASRRLPCDLWSPGRRTPSRVSPTRIWIRRQSS
jgi:glyoxylate carboligase